MIDISGIPYATCLKRLARKKTALTGDQVIQKKLAAIHDDPFAMELAKRLAIADTSRLIGDSFAGCYRSYGADLIAGMAWVQLTIICLEDKLFGKGRPGSILHHPMLNDFPRLRDIDAARQDDDIFQTARRFQAAYESLNSFDAHKLLNRGVSTFNRQFATISDPEPLWIVIAGLKRLLIDSSIETC
jgi:hypothetical protein